jgi:hypothetical protein
MAMDEECVYLTRTASGALEMKLALAELSSEELILAAGCSLDTHPGTSNWVQKAGGLPEYICNIAKDIHEEKGKSIGNAIQIAVGVVKRWAKGVGNVDAKTRAKAAAAVAEWEAKRAKARATPG